MTREEALETLLDNAENGMIDVEEVKCVFAELDDTDTNIEKMAKRIPVPASPAGATHWDECENCKTTVIPEDNYCRGCGFKLEG